MYGIIGFEDLRGGGEGVEIEIEVRMTGWRGRGGFWGENERRGILGGRVGIRVMSDLLWVL